MSGQLTSEVTVVPIADDQDVEVRPGQPFPGPYRGSRYSIVDSRRHDTVLQWKYNDLVVHVDPPANMVKQIKSLGKSRGSGKGSIRITADREVLTKVHSSRYSRSEQAPVDDGWIPVYIGQLNGNLNFDINNDPNPPDDELWIWGGFPFNHGETWSVSHDDRLVWKWKDYRFYSAFDHSDIINVYDRYRTVSGRLYINEFGNVFVNAPRDSIPPDETESVEDVFDRWQSHIKEKGDAAAQRLVKRRLKVTGDGDPSEGHLPLYIGHLSKFDSGAIPKPVVTDEEYYMVASREERGGH